MTLAMHGKTRKRRGMLILAALFAVMGAILAGATLRPADEAAAAEPQVVRICKYYLRGGPQIEESRTFDFSFHIESNEPQNGAEWDGQRSVLAYYGFETACSSGIPVPDTGTISVTELADPTWDHFPQFPIVRKTIQGQSQPDELSTVTTTLTLNGECPESSPCLITYTNRKDYDPQTDYGESLFSVCKEYQATGPIDDFDHEFHFNFVTYEPFPGGQTLSDVDFTLTVDEGSTECQEFSISNWVGMGISEEVLPGWYQALTMVYNGNAGVIAEHTNIWLESQGECEFVTCELRFINREGEEESTEDPIEVDNSIIVCKYYEQGGPLDDFGREFDFSLYIDEAPFGNADVIHDFSITVDEGQSNCTDAMQIPANATIGVQEIGSAGFTNHPDYPQYQLIQDGQEADFGQESLFFFDNENDCQPEMPCVVNFFNKPVEEAEYPIRICKTLVDNGDGYQRPDTTFMFNANWTQTTITVAEGETDCVVVWAQPSPDNGILTVSEVLIPGFEQAPGFMKRKLDTYPVQSTPDMGIHAGSILLKLDDGCYEPYLEIEGGLSLVRDVMSVVMEETTEPFICTVYFFNQEVPNDGPDCEVNCDPECEADCSEPECEVDCGTEPECEVNCDLPVCEFVNCEPPCVEDCGGEPTCEVSCDEPQCIDCDGPTPTPETPTVPNEPQTTPEPEEDVEGDTTQGPQATPKAPDTGSSLVEDSQSHAGVLAMASAAMLTASVGAGIAGVAMRRRQ